MTRTRLWTLGTAVVVVLVLLAGWLLVVQPTRAHAADINAQTATQEAANAQLTSSIEQLKVMAKDLPAQEAKLESIRQHIPTAPQLPSFIRQLSAIADESNVILVSMEPAAPAPLGAATPAAGTDTTAGAGVTLDATPAGTLNYVAANVTVLGGYFNTEQFFTKLEGLKRSFLVTGFVVSIPTDSIAKPGDVNTDIQVRVFYAPKGSTAPAAADPAATTAPAN